MIRFNPSLLYLIASAVIWGATVPIMKITLTEVPLFSLIVIRMGIASMLLLPFAYKYLKAVKRSDFKILMLAALFGTNLNLAFFFYGLEYTQAINGSVILSTTPILTLIFAHIYLKEKFTVQLMTGTLLALLGIITVIGTPALKLDVKTTIGNISLFMSSLAWVGHEIFSKKALKKYNFSLVAFYTTFIGATVFFPLMLLELLDKPYWYQEVSTGGWLGLVYGIIFASFLGYMFWQKGLSQTTATTASFIFYVLPVCAIVMSIILLGESFNKSLIFGSLLVTLGIVFAEYHRTKTKFSHA